jgi:D-alanyl-D-alanine carboxypeptidase (penicillin-binding protein 5/6)
VPKLRLDQFVSIVLLSLVFLVQPGFNQVQQLLIAPVGAQQLGEEKLPELAKLEKLPVYQGEEPISDQLNNLTGQAIYVMDRQSGAILFERNSSTQRYPASTAKIMTALVVRQTYSLNKVLTVREEALTTGTTAGLQVGEELTVEQLLHALLIPSGNDAALVLANNYQQGYTGFVEQMNVLAKQLHLDNSTFTNVSGLDHESQLTTARDLAILAHELMKDPILREIVKKQSYTLTDQTGQFKHQLVSTQELLGKVPGVVGIKTGTTENAGENLITEVDRDGHQVIIVVLGSQDRFSETKQIINWIFTHYEWQTIN